MPDSTRITTSIGAVLLIEKETRDTTVELTVRLEDTRECLLHWGVRRTPFEPWQQPPPAVWPENTRPFDQLAVQTPFVQQNGQGRISMKLDKSLDFGYVEFVLFFPQENRWDNNQGRNYRIQIQKHERSSSEVSLGDAELEDIAREIIEKEMSRNSWTLMHRFNLCYDLLDRIRSNNNDGLALIFVWLRFSTLRQLDWQRNYNTKPRELGHAMDRLTLKLADRYAREAGEHELIRLILTTLGRGGDAQRVRDEVLHIMHRHHIKEVSGHFMEEWHQKLHNNTTPDDIVICEAYLEFLRGNGNLERFYKKLEQSGVTRQRLESYERPIKSPPDFISSLKDALIYDFERFLGILKEVHSGTDLGTALHLARYLFDPEMHRLADSLWEFHDNWNIPPTTVAAKITELRLRVTRRFGETGKNLRDLLFLDIALEDFLRLVVERGIHRAIGPEQLADLAGIVLENLCLGNPEEELVYSWHHWKRLSELPRFERPWALHARAALDRLRRALGTFIDRYHGILQPKAELLGKAFRAASWTVALFSEEAVRGRLAFAMSLLLHYLDPILRKSSDMGDWQIISPGGGSGIIEVVTTLASIQDRSFSTPAIIVTEKVSGNEEIPKGVIAIITSEIIDVLAHLSVRARNTHVLFATCYDAATMERLASLSGHQLTLKVTAGGDVAFLETHEEVRLKEPSLSTPRGDIALPHFSTYAVPMKDFNEKIVGGKSNNLKRMTGRLPEWVHLPRSAALPFGVFEKVLSEKRNTDNGKRYEELLRRIDREKEEGRQALLEDIKQVILALLAPEELLSSLRSVMGQSGLIGPQDWDEAWMCIKRVWSSKWNERAYLSRRANGLPHDSLFMAVLIQEVVAAEYSYVIHTANPITGSPDEIYAEVVLGLGEALVGNYPGRALSFTCMKGSEAPHLLSLPSKSLGVFGGGLIFRSDSNGEDLAGYAGAGLYDSFLLPQPRKIPLDYALDSLLWDEAFRKDFLASISKVGEAVEGVLESPQDIEGAYTKGSFYVVQSRPQVGEVGPNNG